MLKKPDTGSKGIFSCAQGLVVLVLLILFALGLKVLFGAQTSQTVSQSESKRVPVVGVRGNITYLRHADGRWNKNDEIGFITIDKDLIQTAISLWHQIITKESIPSEAREESAFVTITDKTSIFKQIRKDRHPVTFEPLKIGQRVQVRFSGPVSLSNPVQVTADEIVILR